MIYIIITFKQYIFIYKIPQKQIKMKIIEILLLNHIKIIKSYE